jgi:hypothetical protein
VSALVYNIHAATTTTTRTVLVTRYKRFNSELSQQINDVLAEQGVQLERNPHGRGWRLRSSTGRTSTVDVNDITFGSLTLTYPLR